MESGSVNNVAIVVRSLAALLFVLWIGLWPAPEGAMVDGEPFSSLGAFLLYRYQTIAVGVLVIAAVLVAFYVTRMQINAIAQMHTRDLFRIEARHKRELEIREEREKAAQARKTHRQAREIADLARALAGEMMTCVNGMWAQIEAVHSRLAHSDNDAGDEDGVDVPVSFAAPGYMNPVIFPLVSEKLGMLGWDLAAQVSGFHTRVEQFSPTSFGRNGFRSVPHHNGGALLRHALRGAILQNRLQAIAYEIDNGQPANLDAPVDTEVLAALHSHFGILENGEIDPARWPQFASGNTDERDEASAELRHPALTVLPGVPATSVQPAL